MRAHNVYTTINSWYWPTSVILPFNFKGVLTSMKGYGAFSLKIHSGKLLHTPCYLSLKNPFQILCQAFGLSTFHSQMFNSKYFLSWEKEEKKQWNLSAVVGIISINEHLFFAFAWETGRNIWNMNLGSIPNIP